MEGTGLMQHHINTISTPYQHHKIMELHRSMSLECVDLVATNTKFLSQIKKFQERAKSVVIIFFNRNPKNMDSAIRNPEPVVGTFSHNPHNIISRKKDPGILFILQAELAVGEIITQFLSTFHAKGNKPIALLPPAQF